MWKLLTSAAAVVSVVVAVVSVAAVSVAVSVVSVVGVVTVVVGKSTSLTPSMHTYVHSASLSKLFKFPPIPVYANLLHIFSSLL